ncbi:MAG TPA: hypothetical protein VFA18_03165, partial [Gemmataceae bacterium]|nr:hypothetical protein [Gemmataceae bacterium]
MAEQRSSRSGSHGWRGPTTAAQAGTGRRPGLSWRGRLVLLLVFALALAGALVGLALRLRSYETPFLLAIPITEYRVPEWPINTFALQDSEALLTYFSNHRQPLDNQQRDRLVRELQELRDHHEKKVVVYLSMLAVVRGDAVYLLPIDANPAQPEHGIPLTEVLSDLNACPASNRLLILDIMRPVAGVDVGILTNDVAAQVKATVAKTNYDNLWVLCPCSPGESASPADELQQSA